MSVLIQRIEELLAEIERARGWTPGTLTIAFSRGGRKAEIIYRENASDFWGETFVAYLPLHEVVVRLERKLAELRGDTIRIKRYFRRADTLAATCSVCGLRGGPGLVPWVIDRWPEGDEPCTPLRQYRCEQHRPGAVDGDIFELVE